MFNHKNPRDEVDYDYYLRCVNRFRDLLKSNNLKLFNMIFHFNGNNVDDNIEKDDKINEVKNNIIEFNKKFSSYTNNYILLVIINNKSENYHKFTYCDNIHYLEFHSLSEPLTGIIFINNNDDFYLHNIVLKLYF